MSTFDLRLNLSPSFHRQCSIRIEGDLTGLAICDAGPSGLLPRFDLTLPVNHEHMAALRSSCESMLAEWDERWSQFGLDGIIIDGVVDFSDSKPQQFSLWSPRAGSSPHTMLAAAFDCFPAEHCSGKAEALFESLRRYFNLQPPAVVSGHSPMRLRIAPWAHAKNADEIERVVYSIPEGVDLIVDASGMEPPCGALARILPVGHLVKRTGVVSWKVHNDFSDELVRAGVAPSLIELVHSTSITPMGEPIVLGSILSSSSALIPIAKAGNKIELVRAFRREYPLTIEQASKAATELMEIIALVPTL